jgi:predicted metal-dependent hydrolase
VHPFPMYRTRLPLGAYHRFWKSHMTIENKILKTIDVIIGK